MSRARPGPVVFSFLMLALGACAPADDGPPADATMPVDTAAEVRALFEGTAAPWNAGDAAPVNATLDDGVVQMKPDSVIRGKAALSAGWAEYLAGNTVTWTPTVLDARARGDMAFLTARFTESAVPKAGGPARSIAGLALEVYRRDAGGAWKLVLESWYDEPLTVPSAVKGLTPASAAEDSVRAVWDAYVAAATPATVESAIAMLHEDVVHMPPGGVAYLGKEALAAAWRDFYGRNPDYRWEPQLLDVVVAGDLAFVRNTGSETINAEGGGTTTRLSSGWDIFRRDGGGGWKLIHESWFVPADAAR